VKPSRRVIASFLALSLLLPFLAVVNALTTTNGPVVEPVVPFAEPAVADVPAPEVALDSEQTSEVVEADPVTAPSVELEPQPQPQPAPATADNSPIFIDADGCAVDRESGLVLTCPDPAAGPDPGTEEYTRSR
jgi:hypothetical protein